MAQVLVPNIILTKNYDLIKNLFLNKEFLQLDDIKSNERDVFFISGKNNKYLNSFEYKLNVDNTVEILLRIFDFDNNFEFEYLSDGFLKNYFRNLLSKTVTFSQLNSLSKAGIKNKLYFSFGVGNDLRNWADPMSADLKEAYIEIDTAGRRHYILKFVPNNETPLFRQNIFYNMGKVNPEADFGFLNDVSPSLKVSVIYVQNEKPNIDEVLKDLTKEYISLVAKTSKSNCLLLLPSVFQSFNDYVNSRLGPVTEAGEEFEYLSSIRELFGFNATLQTFESIPENLAPTKNVIDFNNQRSDVLDEADAKQNKSVNETSEQSQSLPPIEPEVIPGFPSDDPNYIPPGMMRNEVTGELERDPYARSAPLPSNSNSDRILDSMLNVPVTNPFDPAPPSKDPPVQDPPSPRPPSHYPTPQPEPIVSKKWIFSIDISNYLGSDNSIRTAALVDWYRPLNKINDGVQSLLGYQGTNREFYIDTEVDIIKLELLAKQKIISDTKAPCIVMGDLQAIRNYYHRDGLAFDQDMNPGSETPFGPIKTLSDYSLQQKLTSRAYLNGLSNLLSRRRSNSGFGERVILTELLADYSINRKVNSKFIDFIGNNEFFENTDTPIFMHNLKNSNVLAITVLQNTIPYLQTVNFSVGNTTENELLLKIPINYEKSIFFYNTKINLEKLVSDVVKEYKELMEKEDAIRKIRKDNNYIDSSPTNYAFNNLLESINSKDFENIDKDKKYTGVGELPFDELSKFEKAVKRKNNFLKFLQATNNDNDLVRRNILTLIGKNVRSLPITKNNRTEFFDEFLANDTELQAEVSLIAEYINAVISAGVENSSSFIEINKNLIHENSSAESLKARLFAHLYEKMSASISVRTVPFFWIAGLRAIKKQAIVLSKKVPPIAGPINPAVQDVTELFDFFSGIFNIVGVKHVINTSECYSEFVLSRTGLTPDGVR